MFDGPCLTPRDVLRGYFHAKDENRPHLLAAVFSADAEVRIVNRAMDMGFPDVTQGREAIADVLVRRFGQTYENIYSFYLAAPPESTEVFSCPWLVGMTEKATQNVRVGCGSYDWTFQQDGAQLACALVITIDAMEVLPPQDRDAVLGWLRQLQYPWSSPAEVAAHAPALALLAPVLQCLRSDAGVA